MPPPTDRFESFNTQLGDPGEDHFPITPADADLAEIPRTLYIGTAGNVTVISRRGRTAVYTNVPAGTFIQIRALRVTLATTAANIVGIL